MKASRKTAKRSLKVLLVSSTVSWFLFMLATYSDLTVEAGRTSDELYGEDALTVVRFSKYFVFAAIAVFAFGSLWAKKKLQGLPSSNESASTLRKPAQRFANTAIIISLVLAVWSTVIVFFEGFFETSGDVEIVTRIFNSYLPIILYTALTVTVLLAGFVFGRHTTPEQDEQTSDPQVRDAPPHQNAVHSAPQASVVTPHQDSVGQRSVALAYAIPIIAAAVALIFGLIVYDVTQTAPEVWVWVIIHTCIAGGIIAGVWYTKKSMTSLRASGLPLSTASVGAKNLNFVLSIIFASIVALMSIGYGLSAVENLRIQPSLSLYAYENEPSSSTGSSELIQFDDMNIEINGTDLERNSVALLTLEPGGNQVIESQVDRDGFLYAGESFPSDIEEGEYALVLTAVGVDGAELKVELDVIFTEDNTVKLPQGYDAYFSDETSQLLPASFKWFVSDFLPAILLHLLVVATVYVTLIVRNRDLPDEVVSPKHATALNNTNDND